MAADRGERYTGVRIAARWGWLSEHRRATMQKAPHANGRPSDTKGASGLTDTTFGRDHVS